MKVFSIGPYDFHVPTSGGKAGRGHNITTTLQVRKGGMILKQFRFIVDSPTSRKAAVSKARAFAWDHITGGTNVSQT